MIKENETIREKIIKSQTSILECDFIHNATPKQKEKNKDTYYRDLFRAVVKDYDLRAKVNQFILENKGTAGICTSNVIARNIC